MKARVGATLAFLVLAAMIAGWLGSTYIARLSDHAGFWLVPVEDHVAVPLAHKPRRTVVILVDGLRRDSAETMRVTKTLEAAGQCRISDQGSWTVSRPVYALLSTGVEVDRSGARNNELTAPLGAESIWAVLRKHGYRVVGSSHLPWFAQLFPEGFDRFDTMEAHALDVFTAPLADVSLYHPLYVDAAGHHFGGVSREYDAAVKRADTEIARLLEQVDLKQDLVIFTADHGHLDRGGHGGTEPEVAKVIACFAGPMVAHRNDRPTFDARTMAASIALFLGVPFPRHMRAGEDRLDDVFSLVDLPMDEAYLADRRAAVAHFREENARVLAGWLGSVPGAWSRLYARESAHHDGRLAAVAIVLVGLLAVRLRRQPAKTWLWLAFACFALWASHRLILGTFEFSAINLKERFVPKAFATVFLAALAATVAHRAFFPPRSRRPFAADQVTLVGVLLFVNLAHVLVYGWPLGFPLPSAAMRYLPFIASFAVVGNAAIGLVAVVRAPRSRA